MPSRARAAAEAGVSREHLAERYPVLFHLAAARSWPSIRRHGLLSTSALLDLHGIGDAERRRFERRLRPEAVELRHPEHGRAVLRDQRPMSEGALARALEDGLEPEDWLRTLNAKVFFWVSRKRVDGLRNARAIRALSHTLIEVDTAALLARHGRRVWLTPINTGATRFSAPRGRDTFQRLSGHPFEARRRKGREPVVELCVDRAVPDIAELAFRVSEVHPARGTKVIWERRGRTERA